MNIRTCSCKTKQYLSNRYHRAYFRVQLITICAVVKSTCEVEKGNVCAKKSRDSGQNDDFCADYQVLCSCKSCIKYALRYQIQPNSTKSDRQSLALWDHHY